MHAYLVGGKEKHVKRSGACSVSTIVPAYNAGEYISRCLNSILEQTSDNIEIIVVYSPSHDDTLKKIMEYREEITLVKSRIRLIPSKARNVGRHKSHGDYIAFCDADDYWAANKIEAQLQVHLADSSVGLTYTDRVIVSADKLSFKKVKSLDWDFRSFLKIRFIAASSVMIRRDILEEAGLFDENLKFYGVEDFDLLIRLSQLTNFRRIPGYYTYYQVHEDSISSNQLWRIIARGKVYKKHSMTQLYLRNWLKYMKVLTLRRLRMSTPHFLRYLLKEMFVRLARPRKN